MKNQNTGAVPNPEVVELIQTVLANSTDTSSNSLLTLISVGVLIYGATSVFSELQSALNIIWDAPIKTTIGWREIFFNRLFAILMVFSGGLVLFVSLLISTVIAAANQWADTNLQVTLYSEWVVFLSLFAISTVIFTLTYKFVPDVKIAWHDVLIGAIATALLFTVARTLINWSLRYASISSIFGATGSLAVFLVWIYYSALIFFLGAEFTQVYGRTYGSRWREQTLLAEAIAKENMVTVESEAGVIVPEDPNIIVLEAPIERPNFDQSQAETAVEKSESALDEPPPSDNMPSDDMETEKGRIQAVRGQLQRGMQRLQQVGKVLRKVPGALTSPIGDIAIGVAVLGVISVTGLLLEPWRRRQKEKKDPQ